MIDVSDVAALAELYDRYANAIERLSPDRSEARTQFLSRMQLLYEKEGAKVSVSFDAFRFEMVKRCKEYLRHNR